VTDEVLVVVRSSPEAADSAWSLLVPKVPADREVFESLAPNQSPLRSRKAFWSSTSVDAWVISFSESTGRQPTTKEAELE